MKFNKFLFVVICVVSLTPTLSFAKSYFVPANLDTSVSLVPYYQVTSTGLEYAHSVTYIVVNTQGDCQTYAVPRCRSGYDPYYPSPGDPFRGPYWQECWVDFEKTCNHQTGYYPIPTDKVIFDGGTRLKFIGDGQHQTIARWDRIPFFPFARQLNLRHDNVKIGVSQDLKEATLFVETDN